MVSQFPIARSVRQSNKLIGDGATTVFGAFDFKIWNIADVEVQQKLAGEALFAPVAVTVTKTTEDSLSDFTVTFDAAPATSTVFYVIGARVQERSTDVTRNGTIDSGALETELSRVASVLQELRRDLNSSVRLDGNTGRISITAIPAGHFYTVDASGNMVDGGKAASITEAQGYIVQVQEYAIAFGTVFANTKELRDQTIEARNAAQKAAEAAAASGIPAGGTLGQVVTYTANGVAWSDIRIPSQFYGLKISDGRLLLDTGSDDYNAADYFWSDVKPAGLDFNINTDGHLVAFAA